MSQKLAAIIIIIVSLIYINASEYFVNSQFFIGD